MNFNEVIFSKKVLLKKGSQFKVVPASIEIQGNEIVDINEVTIESYKRSIVKKTPTIKKNIHDFGDRLITPAFVNCHTHIAMSFFRSVIKNNLKTQNLIEDVFFKAESLLTPNDIRAFSRIGAYENILNGNGLIWDHYYHGLEIAKACKEVGLSAVIAPTLQDISGPGTLYYRKMLEETYDINSNNSLKNAGIYAAFGPHATNTVSESLWNEIKTGSNNLNIPIHCHISQTYEEVYFIFKKYKMSPVQFLNSLDIIKKSSAILMVHGIYLNKNDYKILNKSNSALVFCPFSQMIFQSPANIIDWEINHKKWFVATDCVASNDSMNLQKELRLVSGFPSFLSTFSKHSIINKNFTKKNIDKFLSERKYVNKIKLKFSDSDFLLNKILDEPGSFHKHFKAGTLQKGALANITIWDMEHPSIWPGNNVTRSLTMGDTTGAIYNMCIAGKWLGKNGDFHQSILTCESYKSALIEANARLKIIMSKL